MQVNPVAQDQPFGGMKADNSTIQPYIERDKADTPNLQNECLFPE